MAQHLLDNGIITPKELDEAQRTQEFFGGQLASHLLNLGFIDEAALGHALTDLTGSPYASAEQLRGISPEALAHISEELAERLKVCPLKREGRRLRVAMLNPRDAVAIAEIERSTGYAVEPWATCEYRLYQALERYYRIRTKLPRAITMAPPRRDEPSVSSDDSGAEQEGQETSPQLGLDGRPLDAEVNIEDYPYHGDHSLDELVEAPERERESPPLERLEKTLAYASSRDKIAEALMAFCTSHARRTALFAVGRDGIRGISGRGRAFESSQLRALSLPLKPSTIFNTALKDRNLFLGVVPPSPANRNLYSALGGRLPPTAMVLPIPVRNRIVALLYLDDDDRPLSPPDIPLMRRVAAKTGLAFEILLLRGKLHKI